MRTSFTRTLSALGLAALVAAPARAQQANPVVADLLGDIGQVQEKLVGLARAIPAEKYGWRPGEGVRSVGEVFLHLASDNYLLPAFVGVAPPAATGIKPAEYATVEAFEKRQLGKDAIVAEVEASFAHLKAAMTNTPAAKMGDKVKLFGNDMTIQAMWILTTTHLHEHLGQSIAYARTNGVVPPWSR